MPAYEAMQQALIIFLILLIPGIILGKTRVLQQKTISSVNGILLYVAMPMLILSNLFEIDLREMCISSLLLTAFLALSLSLILTFLIGLILRKFDPAQWRTNSFCAVFSNCGFIGIPLATLAFPETPEIATFISLYNVFSCLLTWTLGVLLLTGDSKEIKLSRTFLNPVVIAFVLGVLFSFMGAGKYLHILPSVSSMLAAMTTPLSMIVLGFETTKKRSLRAAINPTSLIVCLLKLILAPFLAMGMLWLLRQFLDISRNLEIAFFIVSAISTAATAPAMVERYGGDIDSAAGVTLATTILSAFTFPLLYLLFEILLP